MDYTMVISKKGKIGKPIRVGTVYESPSVYLSEPRTKLI